MDLRKWMAAAALACLCHGPLCGEASADPIPLQLAAGERVREFFGAEGIAEVRISKEKVLRAPPMEGATAGAIEASRRIAPELDELARVPERRGYRVARIPLLLGESRRGDEPGDAGRPGYPILTNNNVLIEWVAGEDIVYLPQYDLASLDRKARGVWSRPGFEVRTVPGFAISATYGGALRCSVKVLQRGP